MTRKQGIEFDRIINAPVPGLGDDVLLHLKPYLSTYLPISTT